MSNKFEQFGKYLLLEKIAAGGMAEIYLARSAAANGLNKFVAIKRILPQFSQNVDFVDMFKEEAKVAINLNHSNVVSIIDFGIEDGQFYLVMEYCEGRNLRQIINELKKNNKSFSIEQSLFLIKETASGLDHAHRCTDATTGRPLNITHRDMSPQNIMVSFEGEVKVIDFGIAKAETESEETKAGTLKGKFSYMSPEQAEGQSIDPRTDVFALGIVLWELLANDRLFTGSNEAAILRKVRDCQVPPIRKINPTVPPELERIVMKALAKDRNVRYQTAANFHRDLNRFLNTQYPDFSSQDFSHFIKENLKSDYQEGREKLVSFAKIEINEIKPPSTSDPFKNAAAEAPENNHAKGANENDDSEFPLGFASDPNFKINFDELRPSMPQVPSNQSLNNYRTQSSGNTGHLNTSITYSNTSSNKVKIPHTRKSSRRGVNFSDVLIKVVLLAGLSYGGWFGYKNVYLKQLHNSASNTIKPVTKTEAASTATVKVSVSSTPEGAEIYLNGQNTGNLTPAVLSVNANKEIEIVLKKNGYYNYKISKSFSETSQVAANMFASVTTAYINIRVNDSNSFTKIAIDGKEILEKPPVIKYPITAEKEIVISATNPVTNQSDEVKLVIKTGETKDVDLNLIKTDRTQQRRR